MDLFRMFTRLNQRLARVILRGMSPMVALGICGCQPDGSPRVVRVASTTSLYDTGLLDELVVAFSAEHPEYAVQVVAVGTGQALSLGERRDADLVFVHAPEREEQFVAAGYGLRRTTLMRNDFVIAGPEADPVRVSEAENSTDALRRIISAEARFASRGDDSGTHIRERLLWDAAGGRPEADWYLEVGQGMGATLMFAAERRAYALTDRATLTVLQANGLDLVELHSGGEHLENLYSLIPIADAEEAAGASAFEAWMLSDAAAAIIRAFGEERYGRPLFAVIGD
jgi:tungstate transport system substrate-binding protein